MDAPRSLLICILQRKKVCLYGHVWHRISPSLLSASAGARAAKCHVSYLRVPENAVYYPSVCLPVLYHAQGKAAVKRGPEDGGGWQKRMENEWKGTDFCTHNRFKERNGMKEGNAAFHCISLKNELCLDLISTVRKLAFDDKNSPRAQKDNFSQTQTEKSASDNLCSNERLTWFAWQPEHEEKTPGTHWIIRK